MNYISKNILATICYYDCLDYPLTALEIQKYLIIHNQQPAADEPQTCSLADVLDILEKSDLKRYIEEYRGLYFLKNRRNLVEQRILRNKISSAKIKSLSKIAWLLRLVPFVRMVGVTGRLSMKNAEEGSDWDILVVTQKGKIWTGRTILTLFLHLIGKRRHGDKIEDRICLNYFITENSLEIRNKDLFSAHEYNFMFPLFGVDTFDLFRRNNDWIKEYYPNYQAGQGENLRIIPETFFSRKIRKLTEFFLKWDFIEIILGKLEKEKIKRNPKTRIVGGIVSADDGALVFLPEPKGPEIFERFMTKLSKLEA